MKNFVFGYIRVSTKNQNLDRQLDMVENYGVDKIYEEKLTGTNRERPALNEMLERIESGDTVVIESLSRLGRSTRDLLDIADMLNKKGVNLISLKESIDTTSPTGKCFFTIMAAFAQFERDVIVQRTNEGLNAARARGRNGGRPKVPYEKIEKAIRLYKTKEYSITEITEMTGVTKPTLYRYIK